MGHKNGNPVYCFTRSLTNAILNGEWNDKAYRELCQILKYIKDETVCYERLWEKRFGGETENDKIRRSVIFLLGGSRSTSTAFRASGKGVPSISVDGDAGIVRAFAEYQSCWHDNAVSYIRQFGAKFHSKGREARVYLSKDESFVYKIKNDVSHDLLRFFDEIINHNILFPATEYVILGFGLDEHGRFCTILKQDAVKGRPATPKEIEKHFLNLGFEKISDTAYKFGDYIVSDLKPSNVVYSKGKCFVIDCFAQNTFDFDNNFYISTPRPVNSAEISFPHLSGASVISDPDRHPHLVKLLDAIREKGGKYMERRIQCTMDEYTKNFDPEKEWASQFKDLFFYRFNGDANKFWLLLERIAKQHSADFKSRDISCMNQLNLPENSYRAARADTYHSILKDRLFWDEIIILKLKSAPLSGTSTDSEKIIQNLTQKIWKEGINSITLEQLNNLIKDIQNGRTETYNTRKLGQIAARLFKDDDNRGVVGGYHRPGSAGDALVAAAIISGSSAGIDKCPLGYFREKLIERWAQENGCWIDDIEKYAHQQSWTRASELDGEESIIYITSHNTVVKIWSMIKYNENLQLAVDKIILHNFVFGDGTFLKVKGFTKINYRLRFILEQPKIEHEDETNNGIAIREHLKEKFPGRDIDKQKGQYIVHLPGFSVYDLHGGNVVRSKNGKFYVIDCNIRYVKENTTPWYLRGLEGTEQSTDDVFSSCFFCKRCLVNEPFSYDAVAPFSMIYPRVCGHGATSSPQTRTCDGFLPRVSVGLFDNEIALLKLKLAAPSAEASKKKTPPPSAADIIAMLDSHEFSGEPYTDADKEILRQYQGKGGKAKQYGADTGILNQYYTPIWVCEYMYQLAKHYGYQGGNILEPSAATGNMLYPFYSRGDYKHIDAFEIDNITAKICKILYPDTEVFNQYFETAFLEYPRFASKARKSWLKNAPYDLVIGNPPYGIHKNLYSGYFTGKDHFQQIEMFFIYKGLQLLRPGGLLIYITSTNFMSTGMKTYATAKRLIGEIADFKDAYRLPSVFDNTPICTDIIVLQKK